MHTILKISLVVAALAVLPASGDSGPQPYLAAGNEPDAAKFLQAFPDPASGVGQYEVAVYEKTRAYETSSNPAESARWKLATLDADLTTPAVLADFGCALGTALTPANAPHLATVFDRAKNDAGIVIANAKKDFHRDRPFIGNTQDTCVDRSTVGNPPDYSPSYPSGHTTLSWMFALILAEIAPDRSTAILARGRAYGESRVVCGMHWPSDVEAGRTTGAAVFAALQSDPGFRADVDAARTEVAIARANPAPPDAARCAMENAAAAKQPW
jgi:acid phosphatase (class A)